MVAALISKFIWQQNRSADPESKVSNKPIDYAGIIVSTMLVFLIIYVSYKINMVEVLPDRIKDLTDFYSSR